MSRRLLIVLSTIFAERGGIPRFNQMLCAAIDQLAPQLGLDAAVISQDDDESHYDEAGRPWQRLAFVPGRGQLGVAARALTRCLRSRQDLLLIGLLGMTPVGALCRPLTRGGFGFIAHGLDIWDETRRSRLFCARRARFVLAVSNHTAREVERVTGLASERIRLLHNTLDPGFELSSHEAGREPRPQAPELLTVSRLNADESQKGVDHTIRAFARLADRHPSAHYRIVGKGSDRPRLQRLVQELGLEQRVTFEQDLPDDVLAERYRDCALFVMPSGQEGFGIVFLEAMRFAKPCIGGNAGGTPDVVVDGETGFLVPFADESALAQALERLIADPEQRRRLGAAGRARLEQQFVFERFRDRVAGHLEALLPPAAGRR